MIKSRLAYRKFELGAIFSVPVLLLPSLFFEWTLRHTEASCSESRIKFRELNIYTFRLPQLRV